MRLPAASYILLILIGLFSTVSGYAQQPVAPPEIQIIVVASQAEAKDILEQLRKGVDFGTLAREKSIDPTANYGGSLGNVYPSTLRTELRDALAAAGPGGFAGPVEVPTGFAILRTVAGNSASVNSAAATPSPQAVTGSAQGMTPTTILASAGRGKIAYPPDVS